MLSMLERKLHILDPGETIPLRVRKVETSVYGRGYTADSSNTLRERINKVWRYQYWLHNVVRQDQDS